MNSEIGLGNGVGRSSDVPAGDSLNVLYSKLASMGSQVVPPDSRVNSQPKAKDNSPIIPDQLFKAIPSGGSRSIISRILKLLKS